MTSARPRVVLVTGLSGAGKASVLRALEDLGYDAVDNPPLDLLEEMILRTPRRCAIGVDVRARGFDATAVNNALQRLRANPLRRVELVYAWADEATLLRRYTESRRRHPLAPQGRVSDGIAAETMLTEPLREVADLIIDTSELPLAALRQLIERHFDGDGDPEEPRMAVSLISFSYARGLPREADVVFDARFLRNPHYVPTLRLQTGRDSAVGAYIEGDADFREFFDRLMGLTELLLPRFVQEGKKYATIAIGCTGGRHRSVYTVEKMAAALASRMSSGAPGSGWRLHVTHRELAREGTTPANPAERSGAERSAQPDRPSADRSGAWDEERDYRGRGDGGTPAPVQAQEA